MDSLVTKQTFPRPVRITMLESLLMNVDPLINLSIIWRYEVLALLLDLSFYSFHQRADRIVFLTFLLTVWPIYCQRLLKIFVERELELEFQPNVGGWLMCMICAIYSMFNPCITGCSEKIIFRVPLCFAGHIFLGRKRK